MSISFGDICTLTIFPNLITFSAMFSSAFSAIPWISRLSVYVCSVLSRQVGLIAVPRSSCMLLMSSAVSWSESFSNATSTPNFLFSSLRVSNSLLLNSKDFFNSL